MLDQERPQQHEMILNKVHDTGVEEWYCPTCGRRFLMHWPPEYKKIVLDTGDENAIHSGGKAGVKITASETPSQATGTLEDLLAESVNTCLAEDDRLIPWLEWMEKTDFEGLWGR